MNVVDRAARLAMVAHDGGQSMICQNCGFKISNENARYCSRCGAFVAPPVRLGVLDAEYSRLLFFPRHCGVVNGLAPTKVPVQGATLGGLWLDRPGADNVLLFFHGNGEVAADWAPMAKEYAAALDASVWLVDYRGYGTSDGEPSYDTMLSDAEEVFKAVSELENTRGKRFARRFLFGRSLGSAPAIHLAWRFPALVDALIVDSGFARITELVRRLRELRGLHDATDPVPEGFADNIDKLATCRMPTLILHGAADKLIPVNAARRNFAASAAAGKRLVEIPWAGHNDLIFKAAADDMYFGAIKSLAMGFFKPASTPERASPATHAGNTVSRRPSQWCHEAGGVAVKRRRTAPQER